MIDGLQPHMFMNIRILLFFFLLFLLKFDILDSTHQTKKDNKFWEPCFEEEENFAYCSSSDKKCAKDDNFKLVRLPGMRVSEMFYNSHLLSQQLHKKNFRFFFCIKYLFCRYILLPYPVNNRRFMGTD